MTLLEIIDAARALLSEPLESTRSFPQDDSSSFWKDSDLVKYANLEQQHVSNIVVQSFENYFTTSTTIDLVAGTREYSLPQDFKKVVRLEDDANSDSPIPINPITFNEKDRWTYDTTASTNVAAYSIKGNSLVLSPQPNSNRSGALKLYYIPRIEDMSDGSDESLVPAEYHEIIVWGVVKRAMFQQQSTGEAFVTAEAEYKRLIAEMRRGLESRQIQRPRSVRRRKHRIWR